MENVYFKDKTEYELQGESQVNDPLEQISCEMNCSHLRHVRMTSMTHGKTI